MNLRPNSQSKFATITVALYNNHFIVTKTLAIVKYA